MSDIYQGASPNSRFLAGSVPASETSWQSYGQRAAGSVLTHVAGLILIIFLLTRAAAPDAPSITMVKQPDITWLKIPGPGGGGGGGGNKQPDPPKKAEIVAPKPRSIEPPKVVEVPKVPAPQMNIPAVTAPVELPGAVTAVAQPTVSLGAGTGGGGGTGTGTGTGSGTGSGLGDGFGGGTGGGVYREGNGVTSPILVKELKPNYTGEAMRARIQGTVTMEAVVMPDGSVGSVHITRGLDSAFGLDQEAVKTVKQWRFKPGMRLGQPVPVLIVIEMSFTLR
ncbi:MAG: TonB family protein [Acidobacteriota bacterium]